MFTIFKCHIPQYDVGDHDSIQTFFIILHLRWMLGKYSRMFSPCLPSVVYLLYWLPLKDRKISLSFYLSYSWQKICNLTFTKRNSAKNQRSGQDRILNSASIFRADNSYALEYNLYILAQHSANQYTDIQRSYLYINQNNEVLQLRTFHILVADPMT